MCLRQDRLHYCKEAIARRGNRRHKMYLQSHIPSAKRNQGNVDVDVTLQQYLSIHSKVVPQNGRIETVTDCAMMTFKGL